MSDTENVLEVDRLRRRLALYPRTHGPAPDKYRAIAEWWRIAAEESANPGECSDFAGKQELLATDMEKHPIKYAKGNE